MRFPVCPVKQIIKHAYFLPYGSSPEFEDTELLPTADDFSRIEDLTNPFHFGSMSFPRFEVTANGMVFLRKAGDASSQRNPVLGVFAGDVNNLLLGNIYFRKSEQGTDATTCAQAEQAILEATPEFIGQSLLTIVVVTWEDVPENKCFAIPTCEAGIGYLEPTESRELFAPFNPSSSHILWRVTDGDVPNDLLSNSNYGVPGSYLFEVSNTIREIGKGMAV
ncbi:uncharacterized protein LOC121430560 [Lytechinus variegatus]|uniref:uncharacterized protein LOC121430560 n=1 Tax=Lytechinus variegatus TaxID=7654 RepID=UPI001BB29FF7|nr:uncharacterized protein LOC121430560 [Lytechinus variegatus]